MTSPSQCLRSCPIVLFAGVLALSVEGSAPTRRDQPPQEALELLDLLAKGNVKAEDLRPIVRRVVSEKYGTKGGIGAILGEAVHWGELRRQTVEAVMESEGCAPSTNAMAGQCGVLASSFRASISKRAGTRLAAADMQALEHERDRARAMVLKAEGENPVGNAAYRAAFASAVIIQSKSPLASALEHFMVTAPEDLPDPKDREVFRAMGRMTVRGEVQEQLNPAPFRSAFAVAFRDRIENAKGDPGIVAEARGLPEELLVRVRQSEAGSTMPFMEDGSPIACVLAAWRKGETPLNRWLAWKEQMICEGW